MGKAAEEILLPAGGVGQLLHVPLQLVRHLVEVLGEAADLVAAPHLHSLGELSRRHLPGRRRQASQRTGEPGAHRQRGQRRQQDKPHQQVEEHVILLFPGGKQVPRLLPILQVHHAAVQHQGAGGVEIRAAVVGLQELPALPLRSQGLGQAALHRQAAAGQGLSLAVRQAERDPPLFRRGKGLLRQADRRRLVEPSGKLQLPQERAAQQGILRHRRLRPGVQSGAELPVDQDEAPQGAGQRRDHHHAAKQLPEQAHLPLTPPVGTPPYTPPPAGPPAPASSASAGCGGPPSGCPPGTPRSRPARRFGPGRG